jgi:hypothetical protein
LLSSNPSESVLDFLEQNKNRIHINALQENTNNRSKKILMNLLRGRHNFIRWDLLCRNSGDWALELLKKNPERIIWYKLCENPNKKAVDLILKNIDIIERLNLWSNLSLNTNDRIIDLLLSKNKIYIFNWKVLSYNSNDRAIDLLEENIEKIDWWGLSGNTNEKLWCDNKYVLK